MQYWWVSQKQTFNQEYDGSYMWSPKKDRAGNSNHAYVNMTLVLPGDRVFSYKDSKLVAIGVVRSRAYSAPKPREFGVTGEQWSDDGWRVDVDYSLLQNKIYPSEHMDKIISLLPEKHSPLQTNGHGNQAYLFAISSELAETLLNIIGGDFPQVDSSDVDVLLDRSLAESISQDNELSETETEQVTKSRRGQGVFRARLESIEAGCRVTGVINPKHLIASHIKPWSKSNNQERLDGNNGLLLSPHIDHLFDKGHITFSDTGDLLISVSADKEALKKWQVGGMNVGGFNQAQLIYLQYHREHVFNQ